MLKLVHSQAPCPVLSQILPALTTKYCNPESGLNLCEGEERKQAIEGTKVNCTVIMSWITLISFSLVHLKYEIMLEIL